MKAGPTTTLLRPGILAACLALAGCASAPPTSLEAPPNSDVLEPARLVQRGFGPQAMFEMCRGIACPRPTPKTLAAAPHAEVPESTPVAAVKPPAARPPRTGPGTRAAHASTGRLLAKAPSPPIPPAPLLKASTPLARISAHMDVPAQAAVRQATLQLAQAASPARRPTSNGLHLLGAITPTYPHATRTTTRTAPRPATRPPFLPATCPRPSPIGDLA